jgi:ATP-dependent helicase YprA (DUF1998 family)
VILTSFRGTSICPLWWCYTSAQIGVLAKDLADVQELIARLKLPLELAENLDASVRDDLDGCLYPYGVSQPPALILFDNVPGGAGHVRRVGANLKSVFVSALERVANCECGPETSCYECLRNYWNQPYHEILARGPVKEFLRSVLGFE